MLGTASEVTRYSLEECTRGVGGERKRKRERGKEENGRERGEGEGEGLQD